MITVKLHTAVHPTFVDCFPSAVNKYVINLFNCMTIIGIPSVPMNITVVKRGVSHPRDQKAVLHIYCYENLRAVFAVV